MLFCESAVAMGTEGVTTPDAMTEVPALTAGSLAGITPPHADKKIDAKNKLL